MTVIYGIGLAMALLGGGVIGLLLTVARYERIASRYRAYEREIAHWRDLSADLGHPEDDGPDESSAA